MTLHLEVLNVATKDIPPERMRLHLCWGNYEGPHNHDIPLREIIEPVLKARPAAVSFEAANPRHEHEWTVPAFPLVGGVGNWDNPTVDSWGGRFQKTSHGPRYWTDFTGDHTIDRVHVNKWREQFLRDWAVRMDRCVSPRSTARR